VEGEDQFQSQLRKLREDAVVVENVFKMELIQIHDAMPCWRLHGFASGLRLLPGAGTGGHQ